MSIKIHRSLTKLPNGNYADTRGEFGELNEVQATMVSDMRNDADERKVEGGAAGILLVVMIAVILSFLLTAKP